MQPIRGNFGNNYNQNLSNQTSVKVTVEITQSNPVVQPALVVGLSESAQHQINDQMMLNQLHQTAPNRMSSLRGRTVIVVTPGHNRNQPNSHILQNGYREQIGRRQ